MAGLTGLFKDPEKLARVSEFLTGMGAGMRQNSGPGVSTLASLGAGFTGGGQNIVAQREKRNLMQQKKIARQLQTQQLLAANQKRQQEANDLARNEAFDKAFGALDVNSPTFKKDAVNVALAIGGPKARDVMGMLQNANQMEATNKNQARLEAEHPGKLAAQQREAELAESKEVRAQQVHQAKMAAAEVAESKEVREQQVHDLEIANAELEQDIREFQAKEKVLSVKQKTAVVQEHIAKADKMLRENPIMGAGFMGNIMRFIGGTEASNIESVLTSVKAVLGFDQMQRMKDATSTGATGLGQIAVKEFEALQAAVASLDQKQESEQLRESLMTVSQRLHQWQEAVVRREAELSASRGQEDTPAYTIKEIP